MTKLLLVTCCVLSLHANAFAEAAASRDKLKNILDDATKKTQVQIAHWQAVRQQVDSLTIDADPRWVAGVDRVITSLKAEIKARQKLYDADMAMLAAGGAPAQAIHLPRPFNDLSAETAYAERMIGILGSQATAATNEAARLRKIGESWKDEASKDSARVAAIDHWLSLLDKYAALIPAIIKQYQQRDQPGWSDHANLAAKYDMALLKARLQSARRAAQPTGDDPALLDEQTNAILSVYDAGRETYLAIADFNATMTRDTPQFQPTADNRANAPALPWDTDALNKAPRHRWLDDTSPVRQLLYRGDPYQGKPTDVFAYYATPGSITGDASLDRDLPALVLVHGGGDRATREWVSFFAKQGYAAIAMDLAGCGPDVAGAYDKLFKPHRLLRGGPGQDGKRKILDIDLPLTDQWPYHAVANVLLAHSLIRELPGVDPDRTAVAGISWGGYVTCIAASVDSRFKAAMPFYGCGFLAENSVWKDNGLFDQLTDTQRDRWTKLWDPARYAGHIQAPVFAVTGAKDFAYPLESFAKTYALPTGPRWFRVTPDMGHGGQFLTTTPEAVAFLDQVLRGGPAMPSGGPPLLNTDTITAQVAGNAIDSAAFHYTTASGPNATRQWLTIPATVSHGSVRVPRPSSDIAAGYFTFKNRFGHTMSSAVYISTSNDSPPRDVE